MADWLVAIAAHQRETRAYDELSEAGYVCYQPKFREKIFKRGRRTWVERMLLGRYILIEFAGRCVEWFARLCGRIVHDELVVVGAKHFRFVRGILTADERPLVARGAEVMRMRGSEVRGFVPVSLARPREGSPGRIINGMFAGQPAKFVKRNDDRGTDRVLVDAFGQLTAVELPIGAWMT